MARKKSPQLVTCYFAELSGKHITYRLLGAGAHELADMALMHAAMCFAGEKGMTPERFAEHCSASYAAAVERLSKGDDK